MRCTDHVQAVRCELKPCQPAAVSQDACAQQVPVACVNKSWKSCDVFTEEHLSWTRHRLHALSVCVQVSACFIGRKRVILGAEMASILPLCMCCFWLAR